ncbi:unnamed protein product [Prorocentrum cordatum]|uniref:Secreted protein n=1 Tax=Prorocentrum cordatum TaxID=2364126 RepID=A0ABN9Q669_9DINO|nr:unnamed protein product [Polarella glacialis]
MKTLVSAGMFACCATRLSLVEATTTSLQLVREPNRMPSIAHWNSKACRASANRTKTMPLFRRSVAFIGMKRLSKHPWNPDSWRIEGEKLPQLWLAWGCSAA